MRQKAPIVIVILIVFVLVLVIQVSAVFGQGGAIFGSLASSIMQLYRQ